MRAISALKFKGFTAILFALALVHPQASALDLTDCKVKFKKIQTYLEEKKIIYFPKLGLPNIKGENFDVRVFVTDPLKASQAPKLYKEVQIFGEQFIRELKKIGLPVIPKIHFIVEGNPDAIALVEKIRADGTVKKAGPSAVMPAANIKVPGIFGLRTFKVKTEDTVTGSVEPMIIYLPFIGGKPSVDAFIIAHELAHLILNADVHHSKIWHEARSDLLAYMLTGSTEARLPDLINARYMDPKGNTGVIITDIVRDIRNPRLSRADQVAPSIEEFHDNSLVLSHAVYTLSRRFGRPMIADLVSWVDSQNDKAVPDLYDVNDVVFLPGDDILSWFTGAKKNSLRKKDDDGVADIGVNGADLHRVRLAIQQNLFSFGRLFRSWAKTKRFSPQDMAWIESVLDAAQI